MPVSGQIRTSSQVLQSYTHSPPSPRNLVGFTDSSGSARAPEWAGRQKQCGHREGGKIQGREGGSLLPRVWKPVVHLLEVGLAALTCLEPRGGWYDPGTQTQRLLVGRDSTPGPSRPVHGPGASSSAGIWRRRSPWPAWIRSPAPGYSARLVHRPEPACARLRPETRLQKRGAGDRKSQSAGAEGRGGRGAPSELSDTATLTYTPEFIIRRSPR